MFKKLEFSRYSNGLTIFPKIEISKRNTDKIIKWENGFKMNSLSSKYYTDPRYGWIILLANPQFSMEFDIEPNTLIRIPMPFKDVLKEIIDKIEENK